jgi:ABC-2 type transport system permease protein
VPVSYLPDWLEPLSAVVFLSWAADLLRDSFAPAPVEDLGFRLAMVLALGAAGFVVGRLLLARLLRHVRETGEVSVA